MCFRKTDDDSWPHVLTTLPTATSIHHHNIIINDDDNNNNNNNNKSNKNNNNKNNTHVNKRKKHVPIVSIQDVTRLRQNLQPSGQCALHIALQRNAPLDVIRALLSSDNNNNNNNNNHNSPLLAHDRIGNIPLMTAVEYGCRLETIEYLVQRDLSTPYCRNKEGKTALRLAIDFACATVQCSLDHRGSNDRRIRLLPPRRASLDQVAFDCNTLSVVRYLVREGASALDMGDAVTDSTPLHAIITHNGPGRLATLQTVFAAIDDIVEDRKNHGHASHSVPSFLCRGYFLLRYRLSDKRTLLHLLCQPQHFDASLMEELLERDAERVLLRPDKMGLTPLHILSCPDVVVGHAARRLQKEVVDQQQEAIHQTMRRIMTMEPNTVRVATPQLPIYRYVESSWLPKDPAVLADMLRTYPESARMPQTSLAFLLTRQAILNTPNHQRKAHGDDTFSSRRYIHDMDDDDIVEEVDPSLLCLWLVLSHDSVQSPKESEQSAMDALQAVRDLTTILMHQKNRLEVCGNPVLLLLEPRYHDWYLNNVRCVLRLIVNALFAARYYQGAMAIPVMPREDCGLDQYWPRQILQDWRQPFDPTDKRALTRRVVNYIRRDSNTIAKALLLPMMDNDMFRFMFPTRTPASYQPSHRLCPCGKVVSFQKWWFQHARNNNDDDDDTPPRINMGVVLGSFVIIFEAQVKASRVCSVMSIMGNRKDIFGDQVVDAFAQVKNMSDKDDSTE